MPNGRKRTGDFMGGLGEACEFKPPGKPDFAQPFKAPAPPVREPAEAQVHEMIRRMLGFPARTLPTSPNPRRAQMMVRQSATAPVEPDEVSEPEEARKKRFESARAVLEKEWQPGNEGDVTARRVPGEEPSLRDETMLAPLAGFSRVREQAEIDHQDRLRQIRSEEVDHTAKTFPFAIR